ncbi:uncharacterized protein LOC108847260 isoform X1 [Raphanus sativus]|uniref:Uncharacterized protein LOC108847260 isoform X1 n=1 Tax=Raphanus sativus TaxID=3726 RepID=A0A9W3CYN7_RAPSA|nr:uncharacterized protein LOC108847260 isoform X1 [Raphanus sativus]
MTFQTPPLSPGNAGYRSENIFRLRFGELKPLISDVCSSIQRQKGKKVSDGPGEGTNRSGCKVKPIVGAHIHPFNLLTLQGFTVLGQGRRYTSDRTEQVKVVIISCGGLCPGFSDVTYIACEGDYDGIKSALKGHPKVTRSGSRFLSTSIS